MNQTQHEAVRDTLIKARDDIQRLERENAALREQVEELDAKWKMAEDQCFDQVGKIGELKRENDALRADKQRLDWLLTDDGGFWVNWMYDKNEWTPELKASRDAIDACRSGRIGRDKP